MFFKIGMVEVLRSINIVPDHVVGYSLGELCCGYTANIFSLKQVILSAYYIGLALIETQLPDGAMMHIALEYEEIRNICSRDIEISRFCKNKCRISGLKKSVKSIAAKLKVFCLFYHTDTHTYQVYYKIKAYYTSNFCRVKIFLPKTCLATMYLSTVSF